jgi:hypothetical protein
MVEQFCVISALDLVFALDLLRLPVRVFGSRRSDLFVSGRAFALIFLPPAPVHCPGPCASHWILCSEFWSVALGLGFFPTKIGGQVFLASRGCRFS